MTALEQAQRAAFEAWIAAPPIEAPLDRLDDDASWPGQYRDYHAQLAWEAWQAAVTWHEGRS